MDSNNFAFDRTLQNNFYSYTSKLERLEADHLNNIAFWKFRVSDDSHFSSGIRVVPTFDRIRIVYSRLTFKSIILLPETLDSLVVSNALHVYVPASKCVTFRISSPPSWTEYFPSEKCTIIKISKRFVAEKKWNIFRWPGGRIVVKKLKNKTVDSYIKIPNRPHRKNPFVYTDECTIKS